MEEVVVEDEVGGMMDEEDLDGSTMIERSR